MPKQVQKKPTPTVSEKESKEMVERDAEVQAAQEADAPEILDMTDELLDEIDDLLEVNAEQFVREYVQRGGQ